MENLIQNFADYPVATLLSIGLLLIIGGIIKGDINLIFFKIPPINKKQATYLTVFGSFLILLALIIAALKLNPKNHPPIAKDEKLNCKIGETKVIDVLKNDSDEDTSDKKYLQIIGTADNVSSRGDKIEYNAKEIGHDTIFYQVSDGKGGRDTAKVTIRVDPKYVNIKGKLIDIFGKPMGGKYNITIDNEICSTPIESIRVSDNGIFELKNVLENHGCNIIFEHKTVEFNWSSNNKTYSITYNPIDSIKLIFCKGYNKSKKEPIGVIKNPFNIKFDELESVKKEFNGKKIKYGILYFQVKFFGSNKDKYSNATIKRELMCRIIQKDRDKIEYDPFPVTSGTSSSGWRSDFNKQLLKGEYELQLIPKNKKEPLYYTNFQIK